MANFIFWSDLHCEFRPFDLPAISEFPERPDAVLLAGDTDLHPGHLEMARRIVEAYDCPVVAVNGNHEFYKNNLDEVIEQEAEIAAEMRRLGMPVHILRGDAVEIAGARIVGATLWTDFDLNPAWGWMSRKIAQRNMSDYHQILKGRMPHRRPLEPLDTIAMHIEEKGKILDLLRRPFDGPTVVMTHHMPASELIAEQYLDHPLNPAFASNLIREISDLDFSAWIFGHSHDNRELSLPGPHGTQCFLSNPRGYPDEPTRFNPLRMLHL